MSQTLVFKSKMLFLKKLDLKRNLSKNKIVDKIVDKTVDTYLEITDEKVTDSVKTFDKNDLLSTLAAVGNRIHTDLQTP